MRSWSAPVGSPGGLVSDVPTMPERRRPFCDVGHSVRSGARHIRIERPVLIRYSQATTAFHPMVRHFVRAAAYPKTCKTARKSPDGAGNGPGVKLLRRNGCALA